MFKIKRRRSATEARLRHRRSERKMCIIRAINPRFSEQIDPNNNRSPAANTSIGPPNRQEVPGNVVGQGYDTRSAYQDDPMGTVSPALLPDLHHSADNCDPSRDEITLVYPSGHGERFSFSKRTQKREHKYARTQDPAEDIITTIEVIWSQIQSGINNKHELKLRRQILEIAFKNRAHLAASNLPTLQDFVHRIRGWKAGTKLQQLDILLRPKLVEHFFDQLHDRSIADIASLLERTGEKSRDSTYGELTPQFLSKLFLETNLTASCTYLDLGSGVGQTCMQASLETRCTSFGVEREGKCHSVAITQLHQFKARCTLWGLKHGDVHLRKGDFLASTFVNELLPKAHVVLVNNLVLEPDTDVALIRILSSNLKTGTRVVSTRPLTPIARPVRTKIRAIAAFETAGKDELVESSGENESWAWSQKVFDEGSVSWSLKKGLYYISIKK